MNSPKVVVFSYKVGPISQYYIGDGKYLHPQIKKLLRIIKNQNIKFCIWSNQLDYNMTWLEKELKKIFGRYPIKYYSQNDFEIKTCVRTNTDKSFRDMAQSQVSGNNKNILSNTENLLLDLDNDLCKRFTKLNINKSLCKYPQCQIKDLNIVAKYYNTSVDNCLLVDSSIYSRKDKQNFYLFSPSLMDNFSLLVNYILNEF